MIGLILTEEQATLVKWLLDHAKETLHCMSLTEAFDPEYYNHDSFEGEPALVAALDSVREQLNTQLEEK